MRRLVALLGAVALALGAPASWSPVEAQTAPYLEMKLSQRLCWPSSPHPVELCDYGEVFVYSNQPSAGEYYDPRGHPHCFYYFYFEMGGNSGTVPITVNFHPVLGGITTEVPVLAYYWAITTSHTGGPNSLYPVDCNPHYRFLGKNGEALSGWTRVPANNRFHQDVALIPNMNNQWPHGVEIRLSMRGHDGVTRYEYLRGYVGMKRGYVISNPPTPPYVTSPPPPPPTTTTTAAPPPPPCNPDCCC